MLDDDGFVVEGRLFIVCAVILFTGLLLCVFAIGLLFVFWFCVVWLVCLWLLVGLTCCWFMFGLMICFGIRCFVFVVYVVFWLVCFEFRWWFVVADWLGLFCWLFGDKLVLLDLCIVCFCVFVIICCCLVLMLGFVGF